MYYWLGARLILPLLINCLLKAPIWRKQKAYRIMIFCPILSYLSRCLRKRKSGYFGVVRNSFMVNVVTVSHNKSSNIYVVVSLPCIVPKSANNRIRAITNSGVRTIANQTRKKYKSSLTIIHDMDWLDLETWEILVSWIQVCNAYLTFPSWQIIFFPTNIPNK